MIETLIPRLSCPDWAYWEQCYADGLGPSVFSSPGWQRLMQREMGPPWHIMFLRCRTPQGKALSLPVLVKRNAWRRLEITTRPVAYAVTPIEGCPTSCEEAVPALLQAAQAPRTATLTWWLPPWCVWRPREVSAGGCEACSRSSASPWCSLRHGLDAPVPEDDPGTSPPDCTYVITLNEPVEEYLVRRVRKNQRQHARASLAMGLEVIYHPPPESVEEYVRLYRRIWKERAWEGTPHTASFFHGVCNSLGRGGELILMRYQNRIVGGGVLLFDRYAAHLYQATTDRTAKGIYPHPVLYKTAMERAQVRGLRYVNLGGVNEGNEGLMRFKREWGAVPTPIPTIRWRCRGRDWLRDLLRRAISLGRCPGRWRRIDPKAVFS